VRRASNRNHARLCPSSIQFSSKLVVATPPASSHRSCPAASLDRSVVPADFSDPFGQCHPSWRTVDCRARPAGSDNRGSDARACANGNSWSRCKGQKGSASNAFIAPAISRTAFKVKSVCGVNPILRRADNSSSRVIAFFFSAMPADHLRMQIYANAPYPPLAHVDACIGPKFNRRTSMISRQ